MLELVLWKNLPHFLRAIPDINEWKNKVVTKERYVQKQMSQKEL